MALFDGFFISDPIEIYNLGVEQASKGSFKKAGKSFSRLLVPAIEENLRMVAAYACHLCANQSGKNFQVPDDLSSRGDEVGVAYLATTAAGRYSFDRRVCAVDGGAVYVQIITDVKDRYFRVEFSSTLNVFSVEIFHRDDDTNSWQRVADDELGVMPAHYIAEIATEVGSGNHAPMPIPKGGFKTSWDAIRPAIDDADRI